jgi:hypothetical protein
MQIFFASARPSAGRVIEDSRRSRIGTLFHFRGLRRAAKAAGGSGAASSAACALAVHDSVGRKPAMMTEVIAILVSVGLVLVTIVSAVLVWRTKQQTRQAATRARTEAVNYLREAQSDLKNDRSVTPQAVVSLRKAKNLADVVFSNRVRSDLNRALQTAEGASQRQRLPTNRMSTARLSRLPANSKKTCNPYRPDETRGTASRLGRSGWGVQGPIWASGNRSR